MEFPYSLIGSERLDEPDSKVNEPSRQDAECSTAQQAGARQGRGSSAVASKKLPIWDIGLICIDLRDSDGALMWQCLACNDHRSMSAIHCRSPRPSSQPMPAPVARLRQVLPHESTSSDTVIPVTAACSWCFTRAAGRVSAPLSRAVHRVVSHGVASSRIAIGSLCCWCWCCLLVLVMCLVLYSMHSKHILRTRLLNGGGLWDCGIKMTMLVIAIDGVGGQVPYLAISIPISRSPGRGKGGRNDSSAAKPNKRGK